MNEKLNECNLKYERMTNKIDNEHIISILTQGSLYFYYETLILLLLSSIVLFQLDLIQENPLPLLTSYILTLYSNYKQELHISST